jgi:nicotinamide-nucleotide amidase
MSITSLSSCAELLISKKLTIAFAESATAGRIAAEFSLVTDAGKFLKGGLVCYDADLKKELLEVPAQLIEKYTPESAEVTDAITFGLNKLIPADIHIGVTGLTCPGGSETAEKPVGTMFIHGIYGSKPLFSERIVFQGSPEQIVLQTIFYLADLLMASLKE